MTRAKSFLKQTYPVDQNLKRHFLLAFSLVCWSLLFLWYSEPMDIDDLGAVSKLKLVPSSTLVGGCCFGLTLIFQNFILKYHNRWTVMNELTFLFIGLLFSFLCLYLIYRNTLNLGSSGYSPFEYLLFVFLPVHIMVLPAIILGRLSLYKFFVHPSGKEPQKPYIILQGKGKTDLIQLPLSDLLYLKASDNYVKVFSGTEIEAKAYMLRTTLSKIEQKHPTLLRTHRSYIINPIHFKRFKTTKSGTFLELTDNSMIPVSKSNQNLIRNRLTSTTK